MSSSIIFGTSLHVADPPTVCRTDDWSTYEPLKFPIIAVVTHESVKDLAQEEWATGDGVWALANTSLKALIGAGVHRFAVAKIFWEEHNVPEAERFVYVQLLKPGEL